MTKQNRFLSEALIVSTVALNALGIGLIIPVMPGLLQQVGDVDIAQAAAIGGYLSLSFAAMQVLFAPLLGGLSDQFGRRAVLALSLLTSAIDYAILATSNQLWVFFVVRIISGISGATFSVSNAALADMAKPEERAAKFGLTGAAFGVGFVLGPVFGGMLGELGPRAPFVAAGALCFVMSLVTAFFFPKTLPTKRRQLKIVECIPFVPFLKLRERLDLVPLILVNFLDSISGLVFPAVWAYFTVARFGWTPSMVGLSLAVYGVCVAVIQAGLIRLFVSRLGERLTSVLGLTFGIFGFVTLATVESGTWALILTPFFSFRVISNASITGLLSRRVTESQQGELQGILAGIRGISTVISIPLMTQVFAIMNDGDLESPWPGAPFALAALFSTAALGILLLNLQSTTTDSNRRNDENQSLVETTA